MSQDRNPDGWRSAGFSADELYIVLENANMDWRKNDVAEFIRLWDEEYQLDQIAKYFKRSPLEIFLLYLDQVDKRKVKGRLKLRYEEE